MVVQAEQLERTGLSCGVKATAFFMPGIVPDHRTELRSRIEM